MAAENYQQFFARPDLGTSVAIISKIKIEDLFANTDVEYDRGYYFYRLIVYSLGLCSCFPRFSGYIENLLGVAIFLEGFCNVVEFLINPADLNQEFNNKYNLRTAFTTKDTIRGKLTKVKPFNANQINKECIYEIPCEFVRSHIGETERPFKIIIKEQQRFAQLGETEKSKLVQHALNEDHSIR